MRPGRRELRVSPDSESARGVDLGAENGSDLSDPGELQGQREEGGRGLETGGRGLGLGMICCWLIGFRRSLNRFGRELDKERRGGAIVAHRNTAREVAE